MNKAKLTPSAVVMLAAGAVMLIASFLPFHKFSFLGLSRSFNAWSSGRFLIATLPALLGAAMALQVALASFATTVNMPPRVLTFTWNQIHLVFGLQALILMLAFVIEDTGPIDKGVGLFLMLFAAIALFVGAIMRTFEPAGDPSPPMF